MTLKEIKQFFPKNKYTKWYFSIISRAKKSQRKKIQGKNYYEHHHILPKIMCHKYENLRINPWNGVLLTPREHFIIHRLLYRFTGIRYYQKCKNSHEYSDMILNKQFNLHISLQDLRKNLKSLSLCEVAELYNVSKRKLKLLIRIMGLRNKY
jgi:hypothetical protein